MDHTHTQASQPDLVFAQSQSAIVGAKNSKSLEALMKARLGRNPDQQPERG